MELLIDPPKKAINILMVGYLGDDDYKGSMLLDMLRALGPYAYGALAQDPLNIPISMNSESYVFKLYWKSLFQPKLYDALPKTDAYDVDTNVIALKLKKFKKLVPI